MDTPVKSVADASTSSPNSVSQFEESPIFKSINNLSPIKPLNSDQSFNLLSFTSPKTLFTSPATDCPQKSKIACSQLPYPPNPEPEPADAEIEARKNQLIDNLQPMQSLDGKEDYRDPSFGLKDNASHELSESAVDACQSTNNEPGISQIETDGKEDYLDSGVVVKVASAPDEPAELSIEPHQCISSIHGGCGCKADDVNNSIPETVHSETPPEFFIQGSSENDESSFNGNLALQLQGFQVDQMNGVGCRWERMFVEAADQLLCDSPIKEEDPGETDNIYVDSGTLSFMENILQPSEEIIDGILNMESIPLSSSEEHDVKVPLAHPSGAEKSTEVDRASTCTLASDRGVPSSNTEIYNEPCPQQQETLPRRCLIFEMSGARYKKLMSETDGTSLMSERSVCTAVTSEKQLVSSKCEVYTSMLPGIGLHLNTLARREKIVVKQEISTYKRQLISIPYTTSSHSSSSDLKPIDPALNIESMQENLEPSNTEGELKEIASQSSAFTGTTEVNQNSTKRKRCKSENVEGDNTCKRCNCKRSKCLKLYCECFAAGLYCVDPCSCQGCLNKPAFEETVIETRRLIEARNPLAFAPKVIRIPGASEYKEELSKTPASARHKTGCNCKKSGCLKKYCECFQGGVGCSLSCRCDGCKNSFGRKDGIDVILLEVTEDTVDNSEGADFPEAVLNVEMEDHDPQVTPISQISRNPSGLVGLDSRFPSFSSRLLQPCTNQGLAKIASFSCNDSLGVPPLRKMTIEDETVKGLKDDNDTLTSTSVKSISPNSKRVLHHLGPRHSPPRKFCRKLILRSISSFPRLPEHRGNDMSQEKP